MEKVYAKAFSCYSNIESGKTYYALKDLTGSPYNFYLHKNKTADKLWDIIKNNHGKGYILTASS